MFVANFERMGGFDAERKLLCRPGKHNLPNLTPLWANGNLGGNSSHAVVAVICPLISEEMSDSKQALEAAAIEVENVAEVIGLLTVAAFGKWRDNRNIVLTKTNQVRVQSSKDIPGILDGEK
jgi:diacylglycerol kinase family enzyme